MWQSFVHAWFPHCSNLPQGRKHEVGFALWQGKYDVSWPPKQVTGTATSHSGQGNLHFFNCGSTFSHGPAGRWSFWTFIQTAVWQVAEHLCSHVFLSIPHIWSHRGHSPKWQRWGCRDGWWQSGGTLKNKKIKKYYFCFHLQVTSLLAWFFTKWTF